MAVTQQQIDDLDNAIASGERVVVLNGQSVTYRSIDDLIKARNDLENRMKVQAGAKRRKQTQAYYAGRGY